jgi:hypothetical protein
LAILLRSRRGAQFGYTYGILNDSIETGYQKLGVIGALVGSSVSYSAF